MTDGTDEYNATHYRVSFFYDLAKASVMRMAFALAHELEPHGATAVVADAGLAALGGDARRLRGDRGQLARRDEERSPHFAHLRDAGVRRPGGGRARRRSRRRPLERPVALVGQLARVYGFTDVDGSRPDAWSFITEVTEGGKDATPDDYR